MLICATTETSSSEQAPIDSLCHSFTNCKYCGRAAKPMPRLLQTQKFPLRMQETSALTEVCERNHQDSKWSFSQEGKKKRSWKKICPFCTICKNKTSYFSPFYFLSQSLRMERSSTWRASTIHRWSTTLLWLTVDTHTHTHSITATPGDAGRGTACRLAWADRNHSSSLHVSSLSSGCKPPWLFFLLKGGGWTRSGPETSRTSSFHLWGWATMTWNCPPLDLYLPSAIFAFPFLHGFFFFSSTYKYYTTFSIVFQIYISGLLVFTFSDDLSLTPAA